MQFTTNISKSATLKVEISSHEINIRCLPLKLLIFINMRTQNNWSVIFLDRIEEKFIGKIFYLKEVQIYSLRQRPLPQVQVPPLRQLPQPPLPLPLQRPQKKSNVSGRETGSAK